MELKDFISQTLVSIAEAIVQANIDLEGLDSTVNPRNYLPYSDERAGEGGVIIDERNIPRRIVEKVDFDVAVTAIEGTETKGGIGIVAGVLALGSQGKSGQENIAYNRIRFSIPMVLPNEESKT